MPPPRPAPADTSIQPPADAALWRVVDGFPLPVVVVELEPPQRIEFLNEQAQRVLGYTLADLPTVGAWALRAYPDPDYRRTAFSGWEAAVARARTEDGRVESMAYRVRCGDGETREMLLSATVLDQRLVVAFTDLTASKRAAAELAAARAQLQQVAYELTENIPAGTYSMVMRPGAQVAYFSFMSRRFLQMVGFTREQAEANPFGVFDCVHPDDRAQWIAKNLEVFAAGAPFSGVTRVVVDGAVRWYSAESVPRTLPDGATVWEGVLVDISAQKATEAALHTAHQELLATERERARLAERRRLLQDMHDGFGTQLASARLRLSYETLPQHEIAELLNECLDDLYLIADAFNSTDRSLDDALADFAFRLHGRLAGGPVELAWTPADDPWPVLPERTLLHVLRIVQEAVNNALKHARASKIQISSGYCAGGPAWLRVCDDGDGMPATPRRGRGLANMRSRARELGAELAWVALAPGTRVELRLWPGDE